MWAPDPGTEPAAAVFTEWHGGEPYALVMLLPPAAPDAAGGRLSREVIFVVDTSGSMAGASIQQARLALEQALAALTPGDRFNVIQFNSRTEQLFPASVPAGPAEVERARWWVQTLQANGGTEMVPALRAALEGVTETGVVRQVVFVTDGLVENEDLAPGDRVRLETADGARHDYAVTDILVVHTRDVEILWDMGDSRLTLVTCFPFDAVVPGGPLRYVVRAAGVTRSARAIPRRAEERPARAPGPARSPIPRA
jgi:hypothetical protein